MLDLNNATYYDFITINWVDCIKYIHFPQIPNKRNFMVDQTFACHLKGLIFSFCSA